jgi:hypothetical protein
MKITIRLNNLVVSGARLWPVPGNTQVHTVKVAGSGGADLPGASVIINTSGLGGAFVYANLVSPITLTGGLSYYIIVSEGAFAGNGLDAFYNNSCTITTTADAVLNYPVYQYLGTFYQNSVAPATYGPVDFRYTVGPPGPITGVRSRIME